MRSEPGSENAVIDSTAGPRAYRTRTQQDDGSIVVTLPDGTRLDLDTRHPPPGSERAHAHWARTCTHHVFDRCPICFSDALTAEHVPPKSIGGVVLTRTCFGCNNDSKAEAQLAGHVKQRLRRTSFTSDSVQGRRMTGPITVVSQGDGRPVFVINDTRSELSKMLQTYGRVTFHVEKSSNALWRAAVLKHAYLAACVLLGRIPESTNSDEIRAELLTYRARELTDLGDLAKSLPMYRGYHMHPRSGLVLVADPEQAGIYLLMIQLAGFGFVSWPLPDVADQILEDMNRDRPDGRWVQLAQ